MADLQKAAHFKNLGNQAFKAKKFEEAVQHFTQAISFNPQDHVFYSNRSGSYVNLANYQKALEDAETCIKLNSQWGKGYQRKGTALYFLQKYDEAIDAYKKGITLDPNNAQLKQDLKAAEAKKNQAENPMNNPNYLQGIIKLMSNPETKDYFNDPGFMQKIQMILKNPQLIQPMMQQDPRIKKAFDIIASDIPAGFDFQNMMGKGGFKQEQPMPEEKPKKEEKKEEKKQEKKEEKSKMDIEDPAEDLKNKGNEQFKKKNFQLSVGFYQQAIDLKPQQPLYYNNKAAAYIEMGDYQKANEQLQKAEKLFQDGIINDFVKKAKVFARKASLLAKQNNLQESIKYYQKSLMEDSNHKVKDELNKIKKLKKQMDAKEYINPQIAQQNCEAGNALFKQGKFPQALKQYEEAIKRNPQVAKYYSNLGTVYIKLMEFNKARDNFDLALQKDPNFVKAYAKKGDCHFFLKQYHKALQAFEKGLKLQPDNEICKKGIQKTQAAIYNSHSQEDQQQRAKRAMQDPEIQKILQTPQVRNALADLQRDPKSINHILKNPALADKIQKLIEAGVIGMG